MRNHVRYKPFGLCLWALFLVLAHVPLTFAQGTAQGTQHFARSWQTGNEFLVQSNGGPNPFPSAAAACAFTASLPPGGVVATGSSVSGLVCTVTGTFNGNAYPSYVYTIRTSAGAITLPCPASGTSGIRNFTIGYGSSPNDGAPSAPEIAAYQSLRGSTACSVGGGSSCSVTVGSDAVMAYAGTQPTSTGLYRFSVDMPVVFTGSACTPSPTETDASDATTAPPACPGTFGTVSGRPVCIPSTPPQQKPAPTTSSGSPVNLITGNPPAGSNGSDSLGNRVPSSGTNGGNAGSPVSVQDGLSGTYGKGLPTAGGTTAATAGSGGSSLRAEDIKTDCDKKPNSVGCSEYGTPDSTVSLGRTDSGFSSITSVAFGSSASCPASLLFDVAGRPYSVSFQPICTNANDYIRPVVLVLGAALAAFIFVAGFRS